ncbi:MAG: dUTP diphosphatase [Cetobacterium sp.]|uniref:dUTP diphosphatase n=1 Tax=Cetobacterium sp. TaxID=2071632 RepID=UPI003EE5383A
MKVKIIPSEWNNPSMEIPKKASAGAAGVDVRANLAMPKVLKPGETVLIPIGFRMYIEDPAYAAILLPRSGLGHKHGIILGNTIGLLDSDYQGEIMVSLLNRSSEDFKVNPGERIAQMVIVPVINPEFVTVDSFEATERGDGGFGHTGTK